MPSCSRLRYIESHPRTSRLWPADRAPLGTLVLLHAFPLCARMWEPQHLFADRGWHVVMPQFRGFDCSTSDGADAARMEDYASDVADLVETLGIDRAVIVGLSMGGYVAFALYRLAPQLFQALVLADTRPDADSPEARANRLRLIELAASGGASAIADDMLPKLVGESTRRLRPQVLDRVRQLVSGNQAPAIQSALRAMMTREDSTGLLSSIAVPTLVIAGEEDGVTPPAVAGALAAAIDGAELAAIPRAGHLSSLENPEAFNAALLRFLDRL
jgi:pimeloyl-ACP methyl ester carboxylesterase